MPVADTDIVLYLSTVAGSVGGSESGTPAGSLGKWISATAVVDASLNNVFDDVSAAENEGLVVDYRCVFVQNDHATDSFYAPRIWIATGSVDTDIAIALDPTGPVPGDDTSAQAVEIANELTAPTGPSFSVPIDEAGGLVLGDLPAGWCAGVWIRRTATDSGVVATDAVVLRIGRVT